MNIRSQYDEKEMDLLRQREVDESLGKMPKAEEIVKALVKLKNGKAAGNTNIHREMLKV